MEIVKITDLAAIAGLPDIARDFILGGPGPKVKLGSAERLELAIADWSSATMTTLTAIKDLMAACEEETRASIVKWIAAAPDRMDAQKLAGAKAIHHMHEIGLRTAASDIAESIRTRADLMERGKPGQ